MLLDDLGTLLQTAGLGILGTTLFKGQIPLEAAPGAVADALMGLLEIPGLPPMRAHEEAGAVIEQPVVQVVVRGAPHDYEGPMHVAQDAWEALDGVVNVEVGGTRYLWIYGMQMPWWLMTDDFDRPLFVFTVRVGKEAEP